MKGDFVYQEMESLQADGVDFVSLDFVKNSFKGTIYSSFSIRLWEQEIYCPKTNRAYWKIDSEGHKYYLPKEEATKQ